MPGEIRIRIISNAPDWAQGIVKRLRAEGMRALWWPPDAYVIAWQHEAQQTPVEAAPDLMKDLTCEEMDVSTRSGTTPERRWHITKEPAPTQKS